jgi:hypothetical protein
VQQSLVAGRKSVDIAACVDQDDGRVRAQRHHVADYDRSWPRQAAIAIEREIYQMVKANPERVPST